MNRIYNSLNPFLVLFVGLLACEGIESKQYFVVSSENTPIIDGRIDACWQVADRQQVDGDLIGEVDWGGQKDLSAFFRCINNNGDLYFLIEVIDDIKRSYNTQNVNYWENDNVEFFFTKAKKKPQSELTLSDTVDYFNFTYDSDMIISTCSVFQIPEGGTDIAIVPVTPKDTALVSYEMSNTADGYLLEVFFSRKMGFVNKEHIGFNLEITDNDNDSKEEGFIKGRESGIAWGNGSIRNSWRETRFYGDLIF